MRSYSFVREVMKIMGYDDATIDSKIAELDDDPDAYQRLLAELEDEIPPLRSKSNENY